SRYVPSASAVATGNTADGLAGSSGWNATIAPAAGRPFTSSRPATGCSAGRSRPPHPSAAAATTRLGQPERVQDVLNLLAFHRPPAGGRVGVLSLPDVDLTVQAPPVGGRSQQLERDRILARRRPVPGRRGAHGEPAVLAGHPVRGELDGPHVEFRVEC